MIIVYVCCWGGQEDAQWTTTWSGSVLSRSLVATRLVTKAMSHITWRLSPITYRLLSIPYRLSRIACRLSPIAHHLSPIASRLLPIPSICTSFMDPKCACAYSLHKRILLNSSADWLRPARILMLWICRLPIVENNLTGPGIHIYIYICIYVHMYIYIYIFSHVGSQNY